MSLFLACKSYDVAITFNNLFIAFALVWEFAFTAILEPTLGVFEIAAAVFTKCIERAVAKQTIKIIGILGWMAREEFTILVIEEFIVIHGRVLSLLLKSNQYTSSFTTSGGSSSFSGCDR